MPRADFGRKFLENSLEKVLVKGLEKCAETSVRYFDTYQLSRSQGRLVGCFALRDLDRLLSGLPDQGSTQEGKQKDNQQEDNQESAQEGTVVQWAVQGEKSTSGLFFLVVRISTCLQLECQRCLGPVAWPVEVNTRLQLVSASVLEADEHEQDSSQDLVERIANSHRLDVQALIEDELILSLPYVPMHKVCPSTAKHATSEPGSDEKRPSPFAALDKLKH